MKYQKVAEGTGDLIVNRIASKTTRVSKKSQRIIQKQLQMSMIRW